MGSLALLVACTPQRLSPGRRSPGNGAHATSSNPDRGLPWDHEVLSWHKLEIIEEWLASGEPLRHPQHLNTARLELAEGRVDLARSEARFAKREVLEQRVERAREGFRQVRMDGDATNYERRRADRGLDSVRELSTRLTTGDVWPREATTDRVVTPVEPKAPIGAAPEVATQGRKGRILPRTTWGARKAVLGRLNRERGWRRITIHHSGINSSELGRKDLPSVSEALRKMQRNHIEQEGWGDIGYHFLIDPSGRVFEGRAAAYQGAHAGNNALNENNVGICVLGHFDEERPTHAALTSLTGLIESIRKQHAIPRSQVFGHKELKATECPGRALDAWLENYRQVKYATTQPTRAQ